MHYFYFEKVANEANIPKGKLDELAKMVRLEFPHDEMLYELHMLRVCMAIKDGHITLQEAMRSEEAA